MKRSEAARYARWSALTALCLAVITGGMYLRRQWIAHVEIKKAPPPLEEDKERQSIGLTLSKVEGDRTIFTVQASKSSDLKGQDISLLEDVRVTAFGKLGDRHDVIHTQSCKYAKAESGSIQCSGKVELDLQSAADAQRAQAQGDHRAGVIHVETSGVTFEKATGRAETGQPVKFSLANGEGEGLGATYFSENGLLKLMKDVRITLQATEPAGRRKKQVPSATGVELLGSSLELGKHTRKVVLFGPATATSTTHQLTAGELTVILDAQSRAQTLVAALGNHGQTPEVHSQAGKGAGPETLRADLLRAELAPEGWIRTIEAEGNVRGDSQSGEMEAERGSVEMWPGVNQAKTVTLRGNVRVNQQDAKTGTGRKLTTNALQMSFAGGNAGGSNSMQHAETLDRGTMEWSDSAEVQSKLSADKLAADFGQAGRAQHVVATGNVETQRELEGRPTQTATAANGDVQLTPAGGWSQMMLRGNVRMKEGDRNAEAQQALFVRAAKTAVLTGQAVARDESSETRASKITFHQDTGEIQAEGKVRSTDLGENKPSIELSSAPSSITADHMAGNSKDGRALYTGHARMWQGPSVLEADSIELLRNSRVLNANGNVRAVFPKAGTDSKKRKEAAIWHISSGTLSYWDAENRAHLEKNVVVQSADERMRGPVLDLYFTRGENGKSGRGGASQINKAVSTGGVVVEQGDRRGTADQGVYTAEDDKFVLSGGTPTLYDASEGTTTGRELTFNNADDTIIVDSGNGMRTLTKHRVQR